MNEPVVPSAVFDTNVLARILLAPQGYSARLLKALATGRCLLVSSEAILAELRDVLGRPHVQRHRPSTPREIRSAVQSFRQTALVVAGHYEVFVVRTDPKDNPILACALEAGANYLVTDDRKDLLPLKHWRGIQIVSVPGFLRLLAVR